MLTSCLKGSFFMPSVDIVLRLGLSVRRLSTSIGKGEGVSRHLDHEFAS